VNRHDEVPESFGDFYRSFLFLTSLLKAGPKTTGPAHFFLPESSERPYCQTSGDDTGKEIVSSFFIHAQFAFTNTNPFKETIMSIDTSIDSAMYGSVISHRSIPRVLARSEN